MTDVAVTADVVASGRNRRETRTGTVVSDRANKTIRVRYDYMVKHPKYGKYYRRSTTLHAHDERNEAKNGDVVEVMACRPMSKMKRWRLMRIVRAAS
jgi:small subunit ribosomal protein S17